MSLDLLELTQSTSERELKRAYARLLKVHRPDEDPAAFQRLRQAYERTLMELQQVVDLDEEESTRAPASALTELPPTARSAPATSQGMLVAPAAPAVATAPSDLPVPVVPVDPAAPATPIAPILRLADGGTVEEPHRVEDLLEGDLDQGWEEARRSGLEHAFQRGLLRLCLADTSLDRLDWAQAHLGWLTPGQSDYLGPAEAACLASKLATRVLEQVRQALGQGREIEAYRLLRAALADAWLQPLDRRSQFQTWVFELLERNGHWTPALFERLCELNGWSEERGHLPCSPERWAAIVHRCHAFALEASLRDQLAAPAKTPVQRATWFLFADLSDGKRRRWADEFTTEDWQACADLAYHVADHPQLSVALERPYLANWRAWQPRGYWKWGYFHVWAILSLALCIRLAADPRDILEESLGIVLLGPLLLVPLLLIPARWLLYLWSDLARVLTAADVAVSAWLLPRSLSRNGSGVLLLRHVVPSLVPAGLVYLWARALPPLGITLALITVLGAVHFADVVTRGDSPASWVEHGLYRLLQHRRRLKLALAVFAGLVVLVLLRLIFG
ncbi:J domain-containing protein [Pseudomonas oryzihabitans]|uniref:J domain-containing protein n=1 Tax=Pseudomonas oryzihabitans TaxID=47885 RepID=UPI00214EAB95|nr:J domain-containing protein [Pseudomonas psychrotolerans]UUW74132.1 J domain-containing protein [Pseudomonas psychrotolerans]